MKTDELIALLATGAGPVQRPDDARRLFLGLPLALVAGAFTVSWWLGLLSPDLWGPSSTILKLAYAGSLCLAGIWLLRRIGRPGSSVQAPVAVIAGAFIAMAGAGLFDLLAAEGAMRGSKLMGHSALVCPVAIVKLSLPALAVALAAARALAPVRLGMAGAAAGLVAGGLAAVAYALACTEGALPFIAVWYSLGIVLSTTVGAVLGPIILRW